MSLSYLSSRRAVPNPSVWVLKRVHFSAISVASERFEKLQKLGNQRSVFRESTKGYHRFATTASSSDLGADHPTEDVVETTEQEPLEEKENATLKENEGEEEAMGKRGGNGNDPVVFSKSEKHPNVLVVKQTSVPSKSNEDVLQSSNPKLDDRVEMNSGTKPEASTEESEAPSMRREGNVLIVKNGGSKQMDQSKEPYQGPSVIERPRPQSLSKISNPSGQKEGVLNMTSSQSTVNLSSSDPIDPENALKNDASESALAPDTKRAMQIRASILKRARDKKQEHNRPPKPKTSKGNGNEISDVPRDRQESTSSVSKPNRTTPIAKPKLSQPASSNRQGHGDVTSQTIRDVTRHRLNQSKNSGSQHVGRAMQIRASILESANRHREASEEGKSDFSKPSDASSRSVRAPPKIDASDNDTETMLPLLIQKPSKLDPSSHPDIEEDRKFTMKQAEKEKERMKEKLQEIRERRELKQLKTEIKRSGKGKMTDSMLIGNRRKARHERRTDSQDEEEEKIVVKSEAIIEIGRDGMSVEDLANLLMISPSDVMKILFMRGVMVTVNQVLDMDSVKVIAADLGVDVIDKDEIDASEMAKKDVIQNEEEETNLVQRPPVVTVMGHVDHGKTSLLDYIRQTRVAAGEAGGITQAIGAYTCSVTVEGKERTICFLDTPGHEAFSAMRARGAKVTDVVIVIIAATDGIRPQTLEAINHAKAAAVPIIVAINKIDAPGAEPDRVKRELSEIDMLPEEWGGKTPVVSISAKTGEGKNAFCFDLIDFEGINELLEMVTLVADIQLNLKANPEGLARGTVIEAYMDKRSGVVASILVQNGVLRVGDVVVSGGTYGKVRSLTDVSGNTIEEAGPSTAVQMLGYSDVPIAGDLFKACKDESQAKSEADKMASTLRQRHLDEASGGGSMVTLSSLASVDEDSEAKALQRINIVLKADTSGSLEAIKGALTNLPQDSVMIRFLHTGAGEVTESDVLLAAAAEGMVVGFNVPMKEDVKSLAKQNGIELNSYSVIYDLIDDVRGVMEGRLSPAEDRLSIGKADVRAVFEAGSRKVAGCMVSEGRIDKGCFVKVFRKKKCVYQGKLTSLRRGKDSANVVENGLECGMGCEDFDGWQEGDRIEAFTIVEKRMTLEESKATMAVDEEELSQLIGSKE